VKVRNNRTQVNKLLVVITGPTASGKTAVGVKLAKHYNSEVISADSRQFYRQMQIGTARPLPEELEGVPHHFLGFLDIQQEFSAGKFADEANKKIKKLFVEHDVLFVVGGAGFYIEALIYGMDDIPKIKPEIRDRINQEWKKSGLEYLQKKVSEIDPDIYKQIDIQNPLRLIRAIEVYEQTGKTLFSFQKKRSKKPRYNTLFIGMDWERELLYQRINHRVDVMMQKGLLEEVKSLYNNRQLNALQTVGYSELFEYLDGKINLDTATELIKRNSRRYAKRQLTWLRKYPNMHWFSPQSDEMIKLINHLLI